MTEEHRITDRMIRQGLEDHDAYRELRDSFPAYAPSKKDELSVKGVFRLPLWKRLWNWIRRRRPGTLWATHIFDDGPITVKNGESLTASYTIPKKNSLDKMV